jgi:glycerol 3-phosphatase-2
VRRDYSGIVCDLDGVVYRGPEPVEYAVESLQHLDLPVLYATNNASRTPQDVAAHLQTFGLATSAESVVTAAQAGAWLLHSRIKDGASVLAVGAAGVEDALSEAGYAVRRPGAQPVAEEAPPAAVLQGYGPEVTAIDLAQAAYAIADGAFWVATNTDATLPTNRGIAPGNGALVQAVQLAVGRGPDAVAGKPFPTMYELAAQRLGAEPSALLAVGDRLETDVEGACRAGMDSLLVLTGVHDVVDAARAPRERRPTYVVPDLRWLRWPSEGPQWAAAGALYEALSACWARIDEGNPAPDPADTLIADVQKAAEDALRTVR